MPVHFSVFLQQVQRYCEKSLISRKVLPLRLYGQQRSHAVSHIEFEVKDAAAGAGACLLYPALQAKWFLQKALYGQITFCLYSKETYNMVYHSIPVGANSVLLGLKPASLVGCTALEEQPSEPCFGFDSVGGGKVMGALVCADRF